MEQARLVADEQARPGALPRPFEDEGLQRARPGNVEDDAGQEGLVRTEPAAERTLRAAQTAERLRPSGGGTDPATRGIDQADGGTVRLLPEPAGLGVVRGLRDIEPATRIVVLTGYGSIATALEAIRLGAVHYLTKPATADDILRAFGGLAPLRDPQHGNAHVPSLARDTTRVSLLK